MVSRHSAFYSPLIATLSAGFLDSAGQSVSYAVLEPGQSMHELIASGQVDIAQSAPSANWKPLDQGISPLPVHFALINRKDGFFLVGRQNGQFAGWKSLEGRTLLADHGGQPMAMLRYAAHVNGVDWAKVNVIDRGTPDEMLAAFRNGEGDYVHLQAPGPQQLEESGSCRTVASVGASMSEVAFSTLCCSREFMACDLFSTFLRAYREARKWVNQVDPAEIAAKEAPYFPGISQPALAKAIAEYQNLGTWGGSGQITLPLYEQALNVFEYSGQVGTRHPFELVCETPEL